MTLHLNTAYPFCMIIWTIHYSTDDYCKTVGGFQSKVCQCAQDTQHLKNISILTHIGGTYMKHRKYKHIEIGTDQSGHITLE